MNHKLCKSQNIGSETQDHDTINHWNFSIRASHCCCFFSCLFITALLLSCGKAVLMFQEMLEFPQNACLVSALLPKCL